MAELSRRRAVERISGVARDHDEARGLRAALLEEIGRQVGFDAYAWLLTDPATEVGSDPLAEVPCLSELPKLIRLKYATEINRWTRLAGPVGRLLADTGGRPELSLLWRDLLSDFDVSDVASVVFRDRFGCWGFLDLWRSGATHPFSDYDSDYLAAIAPAITEGLRTSQARTFGTDHRTEAPDGPVVLVLSPTLVVKAQTAETEAYLRALVPPDGDRRPVPAGAYNVAAQMLALEAGVDSHPARARVHLDDGIWLSLRASRITPSAAGERDLAVTIERASAAERLDLFARAHGLSPREVELLAGLARGSDTRQLAARLHLAENTVQDHLKSVFAKTGTRNRRSLMARALGS
jgi:DNA-binding CsgD family transcriptional regulator